MKKILFLLVILLFISGCNSNVKENKDNDNKSNEKVKYDKLVIKTKITNKDVKGGYLIYFMHVGERNETPGAANQSAFGPFETDENGEYILDLKYNFTNNVATYLKSGNYDKNKLEMFIVTKEDIYIRNPLNKKTIVEFIPTDSKEKYPDPEYYAKESEIEVSFTDKYPDNVISLTFQDSIFVIKLDFTGEIPKKSYVVSIFWNDPNTGKMGIVRTGRISREFQYWDTPFFINDNLASKTGTIIINDYDTDQNVQYEGYPKIVSFDKDGKPTGEKIVRIKLIN